MVKRGTPRGNVCHRVETCANVWKRVPQCGNVCHRVETCATVWKRVPSSLSRHSVRCLSRLSQLFLQSPTRSVDGVGGEFGRDVDRRECFPLVVPDGEVLDAGLESVLDGGDLIVSDWVFDLTEPLFCDEAVVPELTLMIVGARMDGRQQRISKTSVVSVLDIDDCLLLGQKCGCSRNLRPARGRYWTTWRSVFRISSNTSPERLRLNLMCLSRIVSMRESSCLSSTTALVMMRFPL